MSYNLTRFKNAQEGVYSRALAEIRSGRKRSHWIWYIFPQIRGLGMSSTSQYYGIENLEEARAYLEDPVLGPRLLEISHALLELDTDSAGEVFGYPDDLKLRSCMTLFSCADENNRVFTDVLDKFYGGQPDRMTLEILDRQNF